MPDDSHGQLRGMILPPPLKEEPRSPPAPPGPGEGDPLAGGETPASGPLFRVGKVRVFPRIQRRNTTFE